MSVSRTKIQMIGVGDMTASPELGNTNLVIECRRNQQVTRLLFDCGFTAGARLKAAGLGVGDIDQIVISHTHPDHVAGLAGIATERYFNFRELPKPVLHLLPEIDEVLWPYFLAAQMDTLPHKRPAIEDFFVPRSLGRRERLELLDGVARMEFVPVSHYMSDERFKACYGFRLTTDGGVKVFYTCDTIFNPALLMGHYQWADVIIHDCQTVGEIGFVHPLITDLFKLPEQIRRKTWLCHYGDNFADWTARVAEKGFLGFLAPSQVLDLDCVGRSYLLPHDALPVEHR